MKITNRWTNAVIFECPDDTIAETLKKAIAASANLTGANLTGANLTRANLTRANLTRANLTGANLTGANLTGANLTGANLTGANLTGANLTGVHGIDRWLSTPLMAMLDQPGAIRAYKLVSADGKSPIRQTKVQYTIGESLEIMADTNEHNDCSFGINLATFDWCMKEYKEGWRILIAEFTATDIACIPIGTDGKFRVHRCKIVGEKDLTAVLATMKGAAK